MSKKRAYRKKPSLSQPQRRNKRTGLPALILILSLSLAGLIFAQWRKLHRTLNPSTSAPQTSQPQLAKEYIYAGGRLIATEEVASSPLSAPTNLVTTAATSTQVSLSWTASNGGAVDHYQVERRQSLNSPYTVLSGNPTTTSFIDSTVTSNVAYLYRVCAVDSSGGHSAYSNIDLATAITFDDEPLQVGVTTIQLWHLTQLQTAVNAVRATAGMSAFNWSNPQPQVGGLIYPNSINDLRSNLSDALATLGFARPQYASPDPIVSGTAISAVYVQQLRNLVRGIP